MSYFYSPQEMAEMEAHGCGDHEQRYRDPAPFFAPGNPCPVFAEYLARVYEAKGYPRAAANVREIAKL